ncbi:Endonuclease/exonuclease/phosphatase superfamily [Arabidopsis thaliana x Arabidopsis arenosa]|uniref:Endonuclease/exonuclease/phosphatase superfamily n=1 Tax=Arabidopsis thaliana x Arabidopsis arenosa TaxID=1240361 RepID=A0A8T2AYW5_9BRAS|nr:Endonuclease/exonuclease/phosphatase superfamily [Arabidopsis thaliana x Arabidopsis arenosa]
MKQKSKSKSKKKPRGSISPSTRGSSSPAASGSPHASDSQQSPSGSPASSVPQQNASAVVDETGSAIINNLDTVSPVLGQIIEEKSERILPDSVQLPLLIAGIASVEAQPSKASAKTASPVDPESIPSKEISSVIASYPEASTPAVVPLIAAGDSWVNLFTGSSSSRSLSRKGKPFVLESGEVCVKIPNSVIVKNQKAWESFIIGQFYADPPPQALVHTIVNGIWSRQFKDISVSRLDGNAFLFRIPNSQTRRRVLNQKLWQVDGQTMFVADWEPGVVPAKPELTAAPIWLELRNVPFQFFNEEGLEHIAGLVGDPKCLHPDTASKSNLEVAKVLTIIDPRKSLPEGVNVQFDSGEIRRVIVSSPWMPPVCAFCKEIGHSIKRCKTAPITCKGCNSTSHPFATCPRIKGNGARKPQGGKDISLSPSGAAVIRSGQGQGPVVPNGSNKQAPPEKAAQPLKSSGVSGDSVLLVGESSRVKDKGKGKVAPGHESVSEAEPDSSDTLSSEELEENSVSEEEHEYLEMVTCEVQLPDSSGPIIVSFVYAANEVATRSMLWTDLVAHASNSQISGKAWAVLGDFNQILNPSDHSTRTNLNMDRAMRDFNDVLLHSSLMDLNFRGCSFTWWNKRRSFPVAKKIDRILVNNEWQVLFPSSLGFFDSPHFSDHSPSCITIDASVPRHKKPFKFFNYMLKNMDFLPLISHSWFSFNVAGSEMFRVSSKLKFLKKIIRDFSKSNYSDLEKRVQEALVSLTEAQSNMLSNPSTLNAAVELEATRKWEVLSQAEESFFFQRSRVTWLREGDKNTSYFHRMASSRQSINHIHFLILEDGSRIDSQEGIQSHCIEFFNDLLASDVSPPLFFQEDINSLLGFECSAVQRGFLSANFTVEEIKSAFISLPKNKTSGPDGYSVEFFISCWSVVGPEVTAAVLEFFSSGKLLKQWNATTLVLIPKIQNASKVSDFRPISCLNTLYKVISKLLAGRLKEILPEVISHSQSAFLPGRLLSENVLLASELVQGYNRKNIQPSAMLKVDLRKAFDSIRWDFVLATLRAVNFPENFIGWIKECICTPSFSISINGKSDGFFRSKRGLRQGDPLSPYLFVLAMEVFSKLLHSRFASGYIAFHPKSSELNISHLMFADDVMVFFDGSSSSLHGIYETLDDFAGWSGLHLNRDKTVLFHGGLSPNDSRLISAYGFPTGTFPVRYLGLPLMCRKLKINEYSPLLDKISSKFRAWAVKSLSFAGRTQLIASVIYGTINFWISTFILPKGCLRKIESLCSSFLWSGNIENHSKAKVAWSAVCLPKNEGGLGFRRVSVWNNTLCLKLIWLLFSGSGSLWVAWQVHHHKLFDTSFWSIKGKHGDSWLWKSLLKLRHLASQFIKSNVGNGLTTWFWHDDWSPFGPLLKFLGEQGPRTLRIPINAKVAEACNEDGWIIAPPRSDQAVDLLTFISTIQIPTHSMAKDTFDWVIDGKCCNGFSASKTWEKLRPKDTIKEWAPLVWFKGCTPKNAFNMWISNLDRLPTMSRLAAWGLNVSTSCCLCSAAVETRDHLFIHCHFSRVIWGKIMIILGLPQVIFSDWTDMLSWTKVRNRNSPPLLRLLVTHSLVYCIWRQRNNQLHNQISIPPLTIFKDINREIINTINARRNMRKFRNLMGLWLH